MRLYLKKINTTLHHSNSRLFLTSQWQTDKNVPNKWYMIYRWIIAGYFNFVVILSLITAEQDKNLILYPIFLTNWNVLLNGMSSFLMAFVVMQDFRKVIQVDGSSNKTLGILRLSWLLSTLSAVMSVSLSLIYWPLIYTGRDKGVNDALTHAGNAIIMFIDLFIHAHPPRIGHLIYQLIFGLIYTLFSIVYTFSGGVNRDNEPYIYSVLDWQYKTKNTIIFTVAIFIFLVFIHMLLTAVIYLRIWMYEKCHKTHQDSSNNEGSENV